MKLKTVKKILILSSVAIFIFSLFATTTNVLAKEDYYNNVEWLGNNGFDNSSLWITDIIGDDRDVESSISGEEATFTIIGNDGGYVFNANPPLADNWTRTPDPEYILPDVDGIDETGCYIGHEYLEDTVLNYFGVMGNQTRNAPSMTWEHQVELPVNMSDYIITSASVSAIVNGSGDTNLETPGDDLSSYNPSEPGYIGVGDYARFYIKIADPNRIENYQIAFNKTTTLGRDRGTWVGPTAYGERVDLNDTSLVPVDEDLLILYLTKVLQYDYTNFSIILGIDAYCEDNYPTYDRDTFYELRIKNFSLTFTYEKKIDKSTTVSYTQNGEVVNCTTITNASMSLDYKVSNAWPTASPNSEIQVLVNGRQYSETVKLNSFNSTFQTVIFDRKGLKDLLTPNQTINVTFQLYIADEFLYNDSVIVSIDNVHFLVSYMVFTPDPILETPEPPPDYRWLAGGLGGAMGVGSIILVLWQAVFKYPVHVRKIRTIRRKIKRGRRLNPLNVKSRAEYISSINKVPLELEDLKVKSTPKTL